MLKLITTFAVLAVSQAALAASKTPNLDAIDGSGVLKTKVDFVDMSLTYQDTGVSEEFRMVVLKPKKNLLGGESLVSCSLQATWIPQAGNSRPALYGTLKTQLAGKTTSHSQLELENNTVYLDNREGTAINSIYNGVRTAAKTLASGGEYRAGVGERATTPRMNERDAKKILAAFVNGETEEGLKILKAFVKLCKDQENSSY